MASGANPEKEPITMQSITIGRFDKDPEAQGVIKPEDGRWQLVLDKDGYPHLYLQVKIAGGGGEEQTTGMLCLDDMLIEQMSIKDIMDGGEFGGKLPPKEEAAAFEEYQKDREVRQIPCPR